MARKAVQGYTEKSYYDNTKYAGVLATNDPLQEGYFRQLINFNISDTGQSATPRKGYLTTGVDNAGSFITFSDKTVMYKDNNLQAHVVFDFKYKRAYIVDISAYNVQSYTIPITKEILNFDWNDVYTFLDNETYDKFGAIASGGGGPVVLEYLEGLTLADTSIVSIIDANLITKNIIKLKLNIDVDVDKTFVDFVVYVGMFYRSDAVGSLPGNTLVFTPVTISEQPSVDSNQRNLASTKSIIPQVKQNIYNNGEAPLGFVNNFPMIYAYTPEGYLINTYKTPVNMVIVPHFNLEKHFDPNISWAYAYEIVRRQTVPIWDADKPANVLYRSPVFNLDTGANLYVKLFPTEHIENELHVIANVPLITVVPATPAAYSPDTYNVVDIDLIAEDIYNACTIDTELSTTAKLTTLNGYFDGVDSKAELIEAIKSIPDTYRFYYSTFGNLGAGYDDITGSVLSKDFLNSNCISKVIETSNAPGDIVKKRTEGTLSNAELIAILKDSKETSYAFRFLPVSFEVTIYNGVPSQDRWEQTPSRYVPNKLNAYAKYLIYIAGVPFSKDENLDFIIEDLHYKQVVTANMLRDVVYGAYDEYNEDATAFTHVPLAGGGKEVRAAFNTSYFGDSVFSRLGREGYFTEGVTLIFYLISYTPNTTYIDYGTFINNNVSGASYIQSLSLNRTSYEVNYLTQSITKEPYDISNATSRLVFNGNRLVCWRNNVVYISEPGDFYYFKEDGMKEFGERIVKVLQFKNILLVFTVQHLYAIYEYEMPTTTTDAEGKLIPTTVTMWASQIVLYNIMASDKYADVIQVFNQMVLFYSEDGQMFMIKPSTTIDSETRFSLQYFNKSVNDILLNYDSYINERIADYGLDIVVTKDQVQIKALVSVNYIKIFYFVPGVITYIVTYDVINNRYTIYDTVTFTNIVDKTFIESGDLYLTTHNESLYFTFPYTEMYVPDNMCDMTVVDNFKKTAINALIDKGNIDLNNHLNKRFREMYLTFKNLSASKLLFNMETALDDVVAHPFYNTQIEVQDVNGSSYFVAVPRANENDLLDLVDAGYATDTLSYVLHNFAEGNNLLMDFSGYNSSKILTHRTSILGTGKVFRIKMMFVCKGAYKIQTFGIVYKERRV